MAPDIHTFNARALRTNPVYRGQASPAELQVELQKIERFHRQVDRQYNYFTVGLILCVAVPLVLLFTLPVLQELGWLLILSFVLAGIYMGSMRNRARQCHFPRERDRLFASVLKLLKRDTAPQEPLAVQLCLGQASQTGKAIQQRPDPQNLGHELEDWRNLWFSIKGRFLDGNLFSLRLVERLTVAIATEQKRGEPRSPGTSADAPARPARSHAATSKAKKYTNAGFDLHLQLHVSQDCYGNLTMLNPHLAGAVKLLPGAELLRYHAAEQDLSLTLGLPSAFTPSLMYQSIVMLLLSAYHILHLAAQLRGTSPITAEAAVLSGPLPRRQHWEPEQSPEAGLGRSNRPSLDNHSGLNHNGLNRSGLNHNGHSPLRGGLNEA